MTRRYHLHLPGLTYVGLTLLVGLAAVNRQNNLLFWILGAMIAGLLISGIVSGAMMMGLRVRRLVPPHGLVGEPLAIRYAVTNRNRWIPAFGLHIEEIPAEGPRGWPRLMSAARGWIMHLGPRDTIHGEVTFWPRQRGEARFDRLRISTTFPFGIIRKSIAIAQPQHVLVYPLLYELRRDVLDSIAPRGFAGTKASPRTGSGDEYYGMREYRPGDSMRHIAWKRTAALDQLVCLERTQPAPPRLRVILNLTAPTDRRLEEQAISLAASIVHAAHRSGFEVGLSVPGTRGRALLIRRSHWHREKAMAALAAIDLDAPRPAPRTATSTRGELAGQIVVHPDRVDPLIGRDDALHLTARQLGTLASRPIGWDPQRPTEAAAPREAAA